MPGIRSQWPGSYSYSSQLFETPMPRSLAIASKAPWESVSQPPAKTFVRFCSLPSMSNVSSFDAVLNSVVTLPGGSQIRTFPAVRSSLSVQPLHSLLAAIAKWTWFVSWPEPGWHLAPTCFRGLRADRGRLFPLIQGDVVHQFDRFFGASGAVHFEVRVGVVLSADQ